MTSRYVHDGVLVIGGGLAGLSAALASPRKALVLSPAPLSQACSSAWAQGGLSAALAPDDSAELHAQDTEAAGAGLVDAAAVRRLTAAAADTVAWLAELGAPFDRDPQGRLLQSLEAAHSRPRVARVKGDQAGRAIMEAVVAAARAAPSVEVWEQARARALLTDATGRVRGALVERNGRLIEVTAQATILATGGVGGLYAVTTNPAAVRGEGLGLAALAGAEIADPEFVQFHPTALDVGLDPAPLATEALRGEGAVLVDRAGRPFMGAVHPLGDLAPRDVVARAVHRQALSGEGAFLDASKAVGQAFPHEFPAVYAACLRAGLDPRVQPMPVAPAAHYHMGGIAADADGRTSLPGLYAVGECASTGVHGANRLASNSLLEAAAFGARAGVAAAQDVAASARLIKPQPAPDLPAPALAELRAAMSREAGVERNGAGLTRLLDTIQRLEDAHGRAAPLVAARLIGHAALLRQESRGGHFRSDFPNPSAEARRAVFRLADLSASAEPMAAE